MSTHLTVQQDRRPNCGERQSIRKLHAFAYAQALKAELMSSAPKTTNSADKDCNSNESDSPGDFVSKRPPSTSDYLDPVVLAGRHEKSAQANPQE
jgi:hypothetical protein